MEITPEDKFVKDAEGTVKVDNSNVPRDIVSTKAVPALTVVKLLESLYNCAVEITPAERFVKDAEGTVNVDNSRVPRDIVSTNAVPALTVVKLLASLYN